MDIKKERPTILFCDSGMGGLSVYRETKKLLPDWHYLYCFDNGGFPYSERSEESIVQRMLAICQRIDDSHPLDAIVIACNTASTVALPVLRENFSIPVIGTVPAIKPAAEVSNTKHIGLLATKGTVKRHYVDELINKFAVDCKVERLGSTKLVEIAEQKIRGHSVDMSALKSELLPWINIMDLDTMILGCTHFPLIRDEIQFCLPQVKHFMDSGEAIAKRVQSLLREIEIKNKSKKYNEMFCTQHFDEEVGFKQILDLWGFESIEVIKIG
ncbi:glutamate racemase [Rodentibacter caecimuris]|uniref:Glutamate racemase n=1 Tax=Rodentibacter caecimuris TaxID=1796644 RepID=A0A9X8VYZ9_9PAST|nr:MULTISPECIES: glutamate racemase [Pasteurellaceae]AOF52597.1 Glutamate racemase [Pasteurellaceae bacterium NI1060]MCQ9123327.1 glutamate racemase [Rodentibacter heylii]MCR1837365.1 glutamate racemase [Pasteurella caecimuris]MCU0108109.1 glutamate racemase [Pasteurella caecimuris]OOF71851.1 glutamate racemase [Rodentibacter heylii]